MHSIEGERPGQQIGNPTKPWSMSRWEQRTDNYQSLHAPTFLLLEEQRASHKPKIGRKNPENAKRYFAGNDNRPV